MIINWKASLLEYHLFRSCSSNLYCDLDPEQWNLSVIGVSRVPNNNFCISFGPSTKGSSHLLTKAWIGSYRNSQHYKKKFTEIRIISSDMLSFLTWKKESEGDFFFLRSNISLHQIRLANQTRDWYRRGSIRKAKKGRILEGEGKKGTFW